MKDNIYNEHITTLMTEANELTKKSLVVGYIDECGKIQSMDSKDVTALLNIAVNYMRMFIPREGEPHPIKSLKGIDVSKLIQRNEELRDKYNATARRFNDLLTEHKVIYTECKALQESEAMLKANLEKLSGERDELMMSCMALQHGTSDIRESEDFKKVLLENEALKAEISKSEDTLKDLKRNAGRKIKGLERKCTELEKQITLLEMQEFSFEGSGFMKPDPPKYLGKVTDLDREEIRNLRYNDGDTLGYKKISELMGDRLSPTTIRRELISMGLVGTNETIRVGRRSEVLPFEAITELRAQGMSFPTIRKELGISLSVNRMREKYNAHINELN